MIPKEKKIIPFRPGHRNRRAVTVFLGGVVMVLLLLAFFLVDGGQNWDSLMRLAVYGKEPLRIEQGTANQCVQWNGRLVTAGSSGVICYTRDGDMDFIAAAELSSPELIAGKDTLLIHDAGGNQLLLLDEKGNRLLEQRIKGTIYDAHMSADGAVAYLSSGDREKTVLQVFDREQLLCFSLYSDTRYLSRCAVSSGGAYVCAVALTEENGEFCSVAVIYDTDREEPLAEVSVGNQMIYDVQFLDKDTICLVGDSSLCILNTAGESLVRYAYDALLAYTLNGEGYCALAVGDESGYYLMTMGGSGKLLGRLPLTGMDIQLAAGGKYLAWVTDGMLYMSTASLNPGQGRPTGGVTSGLCVAAPGVCYIVDSRGATRYLFER